MPSELQEDFPLTISDASRAFRIPQQTIRNWINQGKLARSADGTVTAGAVLTARSTSPGKRGRPKKDSTHHDREHPEP
jgi:hypothetical protein